MRVVLLLLLCAAVCAHPSIRGAKIRKADSDDDDDNAQRKYEAVIATTTLPTREKLAEDAKCEYTREQSIECASKHADLDFDGKINRTEIAMFKDRLLPWYVKVLAWAAQYTESYLLWKCGDAHGFITAQSLAAKKNLCLQHCADWRKFMTLCKELDKE